MPESASRPDPGARPRAVAIIGPQGSGKSTLFEALLAAAGAPPPRRAGDARDRAMGTESRIAHCTFLEEPWALLDCPGSVEFGQDAAAALAVADL
ncbi:MAG: GTP-binding protein, partial [Vicinamibacterales bacterium]|nr:GTP-binding protein [Vicinamibacterales bacterium]